MSEVIQNATEEFWRPPVAQIASAGALAGACETCRTEFMVGARFCHVCGADRQARVSVANWTRHLEFLRALEFQSVQQWLGLPIGSLISFFAGVGCILAAILVGVIYSAQNLADFQAIQLWRIQWLIGALVAFVAGILLKKAGTTAR